MSFQFGHSSARPKVYLQASLHAEELPGMLAAHHLRAHLEAAERDGRLVGQVVLVPAANPIGLAQRLDHKAMGRFDLDTAQNFNRHYPDLALAVWDRVKTRLGADAQTNVTTVRECVGAWLQAWQPLTELDSLRRQLLLLSHDADVVIDLHCDWEAALHLYSEEACWPPLEPLARLLGCRAVLLAKESGGGPFDERLSGLWWQLADQLKAAGIGVPLPQGCASTTVELRGESDVSHRHATQDAAALLAYLEHLGVAQVAAPHELPALPCVPTPLAGSQTLRSPVPGVLVFLVQPGQVLAMGDAVAEVIDPTAAGQSRVHTVHADVAGVLYARVKERYIVAGGEVGKIAGSTPFRSGDLLGA
ncbi:MAG: M14 family metallopeptidase [Hydrogenophaga sp.]|uniref:M14 family metallopeptidase n=1 Tax=Hydrogenophaga sp. TaxID=1904254 RepID=UPI00271AA71D|nr:M14 family metallopeptidase [Hydrogenophaga sp.]MDO9482218.1 M14 family metallopeptidase [Hydrogenophaga sp.]MDO9569472.1 M14 family metallopeptidase [Hydrogenophaga sp.]MDP3345241.1 M14 family metallopeptidase [Hydrogenophaga sp.]MDP3375362.1 M14 family metallopeptidase [Hydrogenophaga sp.]